MEDMQTSNILSHVEISGNGFQTSVVLGSLEQASKLVQRLYSLRDQCSDKPYAFFDDDQHLSGFVIPSKINSIVVRLTNPEDTNLAKLAAENLRAQIAFYKSHTQKPDF